MTKLLHVLVSAVVLAVSNVSALSAQAESGSSDPFRCGWVDFCNELDLYHDNPGEDLFYYFGHNNCQYCYSTLGICHPSCEPDLDAAGKAAYSAIVAAARRGDTRKILKLAPAVPEFVRYNVARGAIQISSCDGKSVLASLPVRQSEGSVALRALPHTGTLGPVRSFALPSR